MEQQKEKKEGKNIRDGREGSNTGKEGVRKGRGKRDEVDQEVYYDFYYEVCYAI